MNPSDRPEDTADTDDATSSTPAFKVLVVDADRVSRRTIESALAPLGCEIETANDGTSGLDVLQREHVDVIIAEAVLEDMPGRMLMQRAWEACGRSIPVFVFVTADDRIETRASILRGGAEACLIKPLVADELRAHLEGVLVRRNRTGAPLSPTTALAGSGDQLAMADLLPLLEIGHRTGVLEVAFGSALGRIHVRDGALIQAEFGSVRGIAAFFALVRCERVHFRFEVRPVEGPRVIDRSISQLLLDAAVQADGAKRENRDLSLRELGVVKSGVPLRRVRRGFERRLEQRGDLARRLIGALNDRYLLGDLQLEGHDPSVTRELAETNLVIELWADLSDGIASMLQLASPMGHDVLMSALTGRAKCLHLTMLARGGGGMVLRLVDVAGSSDDGRVIAPDMVVIAPPQGELLALSPARMADLALLAAYDRMPSIVLIGNAALQMSLARLIQSRATMNIVSVATPLGEKRGQLRDVLIAGLRRWIQ
ncbi:MAG: response regulator [Kofleriaceae bacterium]